MNKILSVRAGCAFFGLLLFCGGTARADDEGVPCLVFSGISPSERKLDLSKINRIKFGEHCITVSSSKNPEEKEVELLYSLFHHLEIKNAFPDISTGIDQTSNSEESRILFLQDIKSLRLDAPEGQLYSVGIFDLNGNMMLSSRIGGGEYINLETLQPNTYIAIATDGTVRLTTKFILN